MLNYDRGRFLPARWIYVSVFLMPTLLLCSRLDEIVGIVRAGELLSAGWTRQYILGILQENLMLFFVPVLCTLPYASSFIDEVKSGIVKFSLARISRSRYLGSKAIAVAASGGLIVLIGTIAFIFAASILFLPMEEGKWKQQITAAVPGYGQLLCRYFCFGALGAETGLCFSALLNNRYMAWFSPFMAQYLLIILCERYFPRCVILNPVEWLMPGEAWPWKGWSVILWLFVLTFFAAFSFCRAAERRLDRG